jgi:two-component system response regulator FixJ
MEANITYVLDDEPDMIELLSSYVESRGRLVKTYTDPKRFLEEFQGARAACVILDLQMPELHGLDVLERIKGWVPVVPVVFISAHADVPMAVRMMKQGAFDLLQKPFTKEAFWACYDRSLAWAQSLDARYQHVRQIWCGIQSLTPRETEILEFLLAGLSSRAIAEQLGISRFTVDHHREHIMTKLHSPSLSGLTSAVAQAKAVFEQESYQLRFAPQAV